MDQKSHSTRIDASNHMSTNQSEDSRRGGSCVRGLNVTTRYRLASAWIIESRYYEMQRQRQAAAKTQWRGALSYTSVLVGF